MNNQAKMEAQKENERFPETRPNVMEDCNLNIREFLRLLLYNDINQCYPQYTEFYKNTAHIPEWMLKI